MNLWVLFLCRFFLHSRVKPLRIILASVFASLGEVIFLCIPYGGAVTKLFLGFGGTTVFIVAWLFRPESWKYFQKMLMYSYISATLFGGGFLMVDHFNGGEKISLKVWLIFSFLLYFLVRNIVRKVKTGSDFCEVTIRFGEKDRCTLYALVDSGNSLCDPISKNPVSVVELGALGECKNYLRKEKFRLIPYHSVGTQEGILEAYFVDGMEIKKDGERIPIKNPLIAVTNDVISANKGYQMILHPTMIRQGGKEFDF